MMRSARALRMASLIGLMLPGMAMAQTSNADCPSLSLKDWVDQATYVARLSPQGAAFLSTDTALCLPLANATQALGTPTNSCTVQSAFDKQASERWVFALDRIVADPGLYTFQAVTPTLVRTSSEASNACASLPEAGQSAIVIQIASGAIFAAPASEATLTMIFAEVGVRLD